ncbi:hypothetical protein [Actinomadura sp. NPDC048394]|uniref:hypothetical protein n=1 Tax=Actinomadura sp. NPDC048394 TaxID=3158223 RepID=UPI0033D43AEE
MTSDLPHTPLPEERTWAAEVVARLHALAVRLDTYKTLEVECVTGAVRVRRRDVPGCCGLARGDRITCRKRREDNDRLWFYTSWREPIAPHSAITDAAMRINGYLNPDRRRAGREVKPASPVGT